MDHYVFLIPLFRCWGSSSTSPSASVSSPGRAAATTPRGATGRPPRAHPRCRPRGLRHGRCCPSCSRWGRCWRPTARPAHARPDALDLDPGRRRRDADARPAGRGAVPGRLGLPGRPAVGGDDPGRHLRRLPDPRLLDRLHGARRRLRALLRYLNLFMFAMLTLVLGANYLVMFVGWEGVGPLLLPADRLLVREAERRRRRQEGVHRQPHRRLRLPARRVPDLRRPSAAWTSAPVIAAAAAHAGRSTAWAGRSTVVALCLFLGACGKSAQIPLYVWLPDAMEGPTPVSALIHAATMVTAGVYMVARSSVDLRPRARRDARRRGRRRRHRDLRRLDRPAQNDIKKVLAYSTVSQLGYMFLACGVGRLRGRRSSTSPPTPSSRPASSSAPAR